MSKEEKGKGLLQGLQSMREDEERKGKPIQEEKMVEAQLVGQGIKQKETRGRPKKNDQTRLPDSCRAQFSQSAAVVYGLSLMYVMEVFAGTKDEKRIGHSEGAFTLYDQSQENYCFVTLDQDLDSWGFLELTSNPPLYNFLKNIVGIAPRMVLKELASFIYLYHYFYETNSRSHPQALEATRQSIRELLPITLNSFFKYLRFQDAQLHATLKMEQFGSKIMANVEQLWPIFAHIFIYSISCAAEGHRANKYFRPIFSESSKSENSVTRQLTLQEIWEEQEKSGQLWGPQQINPPDQAQGASFGSFQSAQIQNLPSEDEQIKENPVQPRKAKIGVILLVEPQPSKTASPRLGPIDPQNSLPRKQVKVVSSSIPSFSDQQASFSHLPSNQLRQISQPCSILPTQSLSSPMPKLHSDSNSYQDPTVHFQHHP